MTRTPRLSPEACSVQWDDSDLPAWGSAARATFWVGLEQSGPWGHNAIMSSHLDPAVGRALDAACQSAGGRLLLVRHPGRHAEDAAQDAHRTVLVAGGPGARRWLVRATVADPAALLALPFGDLATSGPGAIIDVIGGEADPTPALLICTNGKRDVCCATRGRPVVDALAAARPGQAWECSHTGGHRFAPTGIMLPSGQTLARLDADAAVAALDSAARGELVHGPRHDRGLAHLDPVIQAAEAWARHECSATSVLATGEPVADGPGVVVPVQTPTGERRVRVERVVTEQERKDSCAKAAVPSSTWRVSAC